MVRSTYQAVASVLCAITLFATPYDGLGDVVLNIDSPVANQHVIVLDPVTFEITANGTPGSIIFEDFFSTANSTNGLFSGIQTLTASIDGGPPTPFGPTNNHGVYSTTLQTLDDNDLFLFFRDTWCCGSLTVGQTVTIGGNSGFTANTSQVGALNPAFDNTATLYEVLHTPLAVATVPEPRSAVLALLIPLVLRVSYRMRSTR